MGGSAARSDRPIFVVGCPRSGTTLLQVMLHAHPRIAVPPETRFLVHAYRDRARFGHLSDPTNHLRLAQWITRNRAGKFHMLGLDPGEVTEQIMAAPPTVGTAVGVVLRAYAARFGKPRWGDKRPRYWHDIDVLLRLFPDAQIVHIVRDGRSCIASLKRMSWWTTGFDGALANWLMATERARKDTRHLGPDSFHQLRYENLVTDPETELRRLCGFLGEEFDAAMLATTEAVRYAVPAKKIRRHHERLARDIDTSAVESWREGLEPHELGLTELVAGRRLRAFGYRLSGAGTRPSPSHLTSFAREYAHRQVNLHRIRLADTRLRHRETEPVAARLTTRQQMLAGTD